MGFRLDRLERAQRECHKVLGLLQQRLAVEEARGAWLVEATGLAEPLTAPLLAACLCPADGPEAPDSEGLSIVPIDTPSDSPSKWLVRVRAHHHTAGEWDNVLVALSRSTSLEEGPRLRVRPARGSQSWAPLRRLKETMDARSKKGRDGPKPDPAPAPASAPEEGGQSGSAARRRRNRSATGGGTHQAKRRRHA